jgi:hypothetical protein
MRDALPIFLLVTAVLVIAGATWRWWCSSRSNDLIERWAERCHVRVVRCDYCWFWTGPFFLTTTKGQMVYYVTVQDAKGRTRRAWVRCGGWFLGMMSDHMDVEWDD